MARTRITKEVLIDRLREKFSNEDGTLIELNSWKLVNDFLKEVRRVAIEYKIVGLDYDMIKIYDDNNLLLEYRFRHSELPPSIIIPEISEYIDWCYKIGMTEKNQIRKRLEHFDLSYIQENKGLPLTKIMRNYRNLYKDGKK